MGIADQLRFVAKRFLPPILSDSLRRTFRKSPFSKGAAAVAPQSHPLGEKEILETAWSHFQAATSSPREVAGIAPSPRWDALLARIRSDIGTFRSAVEAIHYAQSRVDFDHREPLWASQPLFQLHADTLKAEFPHFAELVDRLGDSEWSRPDTMVSTGGRLVSNVFFFHLRYVLECLTYAPPPDSICEIGGGYGAPARLWLMNPSHSPRSYVILDFPESLFFSEVFLRCNFPNARVQYVVDKAPVASLKNSGEKSILLCPVHLLDAVQDIEFDLVVNTGSMQEMTEDWIDFWMRWLDRQRCRWFYSLNYFAQPLDFMAEGGNAWSPRLGERWISRVLHFDPALVRQQTTRNYADILAEKVTPNVEQASKEAGHQFVRTQERSLDGQTLLEAMDAVRIRKDEDMMWSLLDRIMKECKKVPKEAYYLADYLNRNASSSFRSRNGGQLADVLARTQKIRAAGQENMHSV